MSCDYRVKLKQKRKVELINLISSTLNDKEIKLLDLERTINVDMYLCHAAIGWRVLFYTSKFYSNMEELKTFIEENEDSLIIEDECGREVQFSHILEMADRSKSNKSQSIATTIDGYDFYDTLATYIEED